MNPAYSVIIFTTLSGAGHGLLVLMGIFAAGQWIPVNRWFGLTGFLVAFLLILIGLLSSTYHLGHPERAWRSFSQWRSSWLSREGILSVVGFVPFLLFGLGWVIFESHSGAWRLFAMLTVIFSILTVYSTAMIYASLRTIRAWYNRHTLRVYLCFGALDRKCLVQFFSPCVWYTHPCHLYGGRCFRRTHPDYKT